MIVVLRMELVGLSFMKIIRTMGFLVRFLLKCTGTSLLSAVDGASVAVSVLASALGRLPAYLD